MNLVVVDCLFMTILVVYVYITEGAKKPKNIEYPSFFLFIVFS